MKTFGKLLPLLLLVVVTTSALSFVFLNRAWKSPQTKILPATYLANDAAAGTNERLKQRSVLAKEFTRLRGYNTSFCFFLDMRIASGKKRCFLYNLEKDSVEIAGLVAHGSGSGRAGEAVSFSNAPNSCCTSLGRYRIGKPYLGRFGLAYKLYGLDETNNKASERFVVFHAHPCVPADEIAPATICESWGCPTVAPGFLSSVKNIIDKAQKPVLLWIYF